MIDVNWDLAPEGAEELVQFESHVTWRKGIKIWCMVQEGWRDYISDFKAIATRPTQKTVADAVECYKKWELIPTEGVPHEEEEALLFCIKSHAKEGFEEGVFYRGTTSFDKKHFYQVCTRAEFEAYVKEQEKPHFKATRENLEKIAKDAQGDFVEVEQEAEKWTHRYNELKCRTLISEPDREGYIVIVNELNEYCCVDDEELKPIKPTISESEMMQRIKYRAISIDDDDEFGSKVRAWLGEYDII